MTTIADLLAQAEGAYAAASARRDRAQAAVQTILARANAEGRGNLTEAESRETRGLFAARDTARAEVARAHATLVDLRAQAAEEDEYARRAAESHDTGVERPGGGEAELPAGGGRARAPAGEAPVWTREDGRPAAVARGGRMGDNEIVREMAARDPARHLTESYSGLGQLVRALSTSSASALVPTIWSSNVIDRARNAARVIEAGAETIVMDAKQLNIGRLTTDPTASWLAEAGTRTATDPAFDLVSLIAKSMTCFTVASLEFLQDAPNADQVVEEAIGKAMGLQLDLTALFGGVTVGPDAVAAGSQASPPSPLGILGNLLANYSAGVLGSGTNGTTITAATPWNELLTTYFLPLRNNEQVTAILMNAALAQKYAQTYDTLGQPLRQPPVLQDVPQLVTNQIPSFTQGTMTNIATDIFAGDFRQVLIGQRMDITIQTLTERYAELGQVGLLATFRGDIQLARPKSMCVYRYIGGS